MDQGNKPWPYHKTMRCGELRCLMVTVRVMLSCCRAPCRHSLSLEKVARTSLKRRPKGERCLLSGQDIRGKKKKTTSIPTRQTHDVQKFNAIPPYAVARA